VKIRENPWFVIIVNALILLELTVVKYMTTADHIEGVSPLRGDDIIIRGKVFLAGKGTEESWQNRKSSMSRNRSG
jgi:hypothetical protein